MSDKLDGLRAALELTPDNHGLRLVLADALRQEGANAEALDHLERLLEADALPREELVQTGELAVGANRLHLAARCLEAAKRAGVPEGVAPLQQRLQAALSDDGVMQPSMVPDDQLDRPGPRRVGPAEQATFADVGGLDDVKKAIHRTIILPFQRPDLYERYGRRAGGGVMLYGPPGCGKTLLARATAGECGLPFLNLRMEEILDPYIGVSEGNLHAAFEEARAQAPCVLFLDELDAVAYARRKQRGSASRALVDQLLQELDAIGSDNQGMLVLAATNAPWDIDDALQRPGRFDRVVFVPPPDPPARERILEVMLDGRPSQADIGRLAGGAPLFSGADLRNWMERAIDLAIEQTLDTGEDVPLTDELFRRARSGLNPTTLDWLSTARNYVEFANESGRYDDVLRYLSTDEAKIVKARRRRGRDRDSD